VLAAGAAAALPDVVVAGFISFEILNKIHFRCNFGDRFAYEHTRWHDAPSSTASYDTERARALWEDSVRRAQLKAGESPLSRV
jgi:hypothetical protein